MTEPEEEGCGLPAREEPATATTGTVDPRAVLEHVDSLSVYAWEAPDDVPGARLGPAAEDLAERFADGDGLTAGDVDAVCLAAIQGLRALAAEQRADLEAQAATIAAQREDIETLRERLEALQVTLSDAGDDADAADVSDTRVDSGGGHQSGN